MDGEAGADAPFGFPDFVRFSWGPTKSALAEGTGGGVGPRVRWEAEDEAGDDGWGRQSSLDAFVVSDGAGGRGRDRDRGNMEVLRRKKPRLGVFSELGLAKVTTLFEAAC